MHGHVSIVEGMAVLATTIDGAVDLWSVGAITNCNMRVIDPCHVVIARSWIGHITT